MPEQAVALARRFFVEVWNNGSDAAMDELVTADVVAHGLGEPGIDVQGRIKTAPRTIFKIILLW